ncbi:hypothetical protein AAFC00_002140 [Neodothiora populina]|uniref:ribonuclease T1 n=1 Tax=Neodothiora populina TaxID=2781224 RepID=A0ABR3PGE3_9PEZI
MLFQPLLSAIVLLAASAVASPIEIEKRQNSDVTCGSTVYYPSSLQLALNAGYSHYKAGTEVNDYPHTYNNYEGFTFSRASGPYQEFPILKGKAYTGGSPGADRIIFNTKGVYVGSITHTGASGNDFVGCSDTS